MGLMDVLNGMQNGPRGGAAPADAPSSGTSSGGGMSPLMMALLGLLAFKAFKSVTGSGHKPAAAPAPAPALPPARPTGGTVTAGAAPGGLGDLLKGGLGGLLAGGAAGTVLSGGLSDLLKQLQDNGHGDVAKSWVGSGPNHPISPKDLSSALGADRIQTLTSEFGLTQEELLEGLSQHLPQVVDHLTPGGKVPSAEELERLI